MDNYSIFQSGAHPIYLCNKSFCNIKDFFKSNDGNHFSNVFLLADENSNEKCIPALKENVEFLRNSKTITIESGEENKTIEKAQYIWQQLIDSGADRNSLLINIGGGVICDLGGFVASTYKRGIMFIHIPTTLLAMVDASIGGKTGVNLKNIKNQIGLYSQPLAVFVNPYFLGTLPKRQLLSGYAEMIKHALLNGKKYWKVVSKQNFNEIVDWEYLIEGSVKIKSHVVLSDPNEYDLRKTLNFGHTMGHALETLAMETSPDILLHGEAVAMGMICETWLSSKIAKLDLNTMNEINQLILSQFDYYKLPENYKDEMSELLRQDKKNSNGMFNFTLLSSIGKPVINQKCSLDLLWECLNYYQSLHKN